MKRLKSLILKDIALTTKNYFFYVTLFFAVLMIVVIKFVVPEDTSMTTKAFIVFEFQPSEAMLRAYEAAGGEIVETREVLDQELKENIQSIGMIFVDPTTVEYRLQGHENDQYKDLLVLSTEFMFESYQSDVEVVTTTLKDFTLVQDPPFNQLLLPLFLVMEPALLGLFLIATMIFSEKEEGTMMVYNTTPGQVNPFILSKVIVMVLLGLVSLLLTSLLVLAFSANYLWLVLLTIVGSFMGSALGLLLASFFNNITGAMMWIMMVAMVMSFPFVTYFAPGFSPLWVRFLPTYYMLFAYKEAAFPTGDTVIIYQTLAICTVIGIIAYGGALLRYQKTMAAK